jgi:exosome complex exonuclease DIS3/RRP44
VALRDDDAEDDEGAGVGEKEAKDAEKESMDVDDEAKKKPREVQPTGRVVGVIKRNWRAYVVESLLPALLTV